MYNLVIADDEKNIREGLGRFINWEELGFKVVMKCEDGEDVIDYVNTMSVDVVLCDIKMNKISGLEVAKYIFERSMDIKVVLMSGYQEFEYAKKALEYNVISYIVKPIEIDEIKDIFIKIKNDFDKLETKDKTGDQDFKSLLEQQASLRDNFLKFDKNYINDLTEDIIRKIINIPFSSGQKFLENTLVLLLNSIESNYAGLTIKEELKSEIRKISEVKDYDSAIFIFEGWINYSIKGIEEISNSNIELIIKRANKYIEENYTEELTLEKVAEVVFLSPVYLSKIYKKQMGINFIDYVTKLRIERAKELLNNRNIKVYEISELIGYKNLKYFYKLFKSYTGYTPNKYREMLINNKL